MTTQINIVRGEDKTIQLDMFDADDRALSVTGTTAASAIFLKSDDTTRVLTMADGNIVVSGCNTFQINMTDVHTADLKTGEERDMEFRFARGDDLKIIQYEDLLNISAQLFS